MGSNPSKSQQLSERFPEYKILPQLSLHPSNCYQLIYVAKLATNEIFMIKETTRENSISKQVNDCENVLKCLESRKIDNMYYSLYQWLPNTLGRFISANPSIFNTPFVIYLTQTLVHTYALLWKSTNGVGLDIDSDNIRAFRDPFGKLHIKVFPPSVTFSNFSQKTKASRNQIKHLGQILRSLCANRQKQVNQHALHFINSRMMENQPNTIASWDNLVRDSKRLSQLLRVNPQQTLIKAGHNIDQIKIRPVSPHTYERGLSPHNFTKIAQNADRSPQISRVVIQDRPITFANFQVNNADPRYRTISISPIKDGQLQRRPLNQNFNTVIPNRKQCLISPVNIHQKPQVFTLHQNLTNNYSSTSPCRIRIDTKNGNQPNSITPSPMRYFHSNRHQPSNPSNRSNENIVEEHRAKDRSQEKNLNLLQKNFQTRTFTSNRIDSGTKNTQNIFKQIRQPLEGPKIVKINKILNIPLFEPLTRDFLQINPKLGVPTNKFTPKTHEDTYNSEQNAQYSSTSSLNLQTSGQNFIQKHLIVREAGQLLGSSIPMIPADKSSSFGLEVSQDSFDDKNNQGYYDGVYEGAFHPKLKGVRHGAGRLIFPSGGSYQGGFAFNKMDGWGKLFYPSGRLAYEGYWKNSKFEGYGKLFNENPLHIDTFDYSNFNLIQVNNEQGYWKYYQGNMKNDMKEGHGVWVLQNGQKYDGEFHSDRVEGFGTFYGKKQCVEGKWENNILVNTLKKI